METNINEYLSQFVNISADLQITISYAMKVLDDLKIDPEKKRLWN